MITVLGASGNTGGRVVRRLRESGEAVRAVGRDAGRLADAAAHGAEPHVADITDRGRARAGPARRGRRLRPHAPRPRRAGLPRPAGAGGHRDRGRAGRRRRPPRGGAELARRRARRRAPASSRPSTTRSSGSPRSTPPWCSCGPDCSSSRSCRRWRRCSRPACTTTRSTPDVALPMVATADIGDAAAALLRDPGAAGVRELLGPEELTVPDAVGAARRGDRPARAALRAPARGRHARGAGRGGPARGPHRASTSR